MCMTCNMSPRTMRAAARGRVEAELSKFQRDAWTGAAAVWREQQRQCLRGISEHPHKKDGAPFAHPVSCLLKSLRL